MKIGFLITVRLKSSRMPFKVLMDLNGDSVLGHVINRTKFIKNVDDIVVCTSTNPQDKPIIDIAKDHDVYYFNGHEEDVLSRLLTAAKLYDFDYVMGITGENPLFSIYYSNIVSDLIKKKEYDFIELKNLPFGTATFGMNVKTMETACKVKNVIDTEYWGAVVNRPEIFNIKTIEVEERYNRPHYVLSLDYKEDFELLHNIFMNVPYKKYPHLVDVIDYLDTHPDVVDILKGVNRLSIDKKTMTRIDKHFKENHKDILKIKDDIYSR